MNEYIISQNCNGVHYAYSRGRFWRWDESAHVWKESHLLAQKFGKAKTVEKRLTPEAFLTSNEFIPMDEYEIDCAMLDALENAKPCKNAPIDPVEEDSSSGVPASCICSTCTCGGCKEECFGNCHSCGHPVQECNSYQTEGEKHLTPAHSADVDKPEVPGTQTTQNKPLTTIPDEIRPAFDYSGLDAQTVDDLHFAEKEYQHGKKLAERGLVHMGNAIAAAHDALCGVVQQLDNSKHGNRGDDSFRAWCCSIGITKSTAYNLLQVSALMDGSSPRQRAILEALPPTLLYAVAKPSAPQELVEKVKNGEVSTNKAYQDLLKENQQLRTDRVNAMNQAEREKQRADAAEAQRDAANADISGLTTRAERAEAERDKARADQLSTAKDCNRLGLKASQEKDRADKAEARAKTAEDALKKQPITGVVDKDEVKRQAEALSRNAVQEARRQAAEAQARLRQYQEDAEGLLAPAQACAQQAQFIADSVRAMYLNWFGSAVAADASLAQMGTPLYAVCGEIMSSLEEENTINPTAAGSEEDAEREALFE